MSTHNACFHKEIRKLSDYTLLSGDMVICYLICYLTDYSQLPEVAEVESEEIMPSFTPLTETATGADEKKPSVCCQTLQKKFTRFPALHGFMFISIVVLDLTEATNDWLLFAELSKIEIGLVYGPLDEYLVLIFLIICSLSSVAFIFEILNLLRELCTGNPLLDLDLVSAINIWLCDVSMIIINIVIALCHDEPVSVFQLTKAALIIIAVFIRIAVPLAWIYVRQSEPGYFGEKFRKSVYRAVSSAGICLMLTGSVTILIFTHTISSDEGTFQFRFPQQIWEGKPIFNKYFTDVGIYFNHNNLKFKFLSQQEQYWIKVADLEEFYAEENINVKISYSATGGTIQKLVINSYNTTGQRYKECYDINYAGNQAKLNLLLDCSPNFLTDSEEIVFRFIYIAPHVHLLLGDIIFNAKYRKGGLCYGLEGNNTQLYNTKTQELVGQLAYMKYDTQAFEGHRLVQRNSTSRTVLSTIDSPQYNTQHILSEATEVWKTGIYGCACRGQKGPTMNSSLPLSC